jgi:DNA mismatch repair protein MutS
MATAQTPMMKQYQQIKDAHPGYLLFYRMGDFFELFGDDALIASDVLQITLTRRRSSKNGDEGIPMCGVPHHAAENYIAKLISHGHKVALCEQAETPEEAKKRDGSKALVRREVTRLFTGGTLTEDSMLSATQNNYLLALCSGNGEFGAAWLDLSTGECRCQTATASTLNALLTRVNPAEILISQTLAAELESKLHAFKNHFTTLADPLNATDAQASLATHFNEDLDLKHRALTSATAELLAYIKITQLGSLPALQIPTPEKPTTHLQIDTASRRNLELLETLKGANKGSLLHAVDYTVTAPGKRLLAQWLGAPLASLNPLQERQLAVSLAFRDSQTRGKIRDLLQQTADLSRALSRITLGRGSPRDLGALRQTLLQLPDIISALTPLAESAHIKTLCTQLDGFNQLRSTLKLALVEDNLPQLTRDGGFVQPTYCEKFAEFKDLATNGRQKIQELERRESEATGITSLKVKFNKVWGYYLEVTKTHADKVPETYIHRQTTTNSQRFSIPELMELERALGAATANMLAREKEIFDELVLLVQSHAPELLTAASSLAELDVLFAGGELAAQENYCCPELTDGTAFTISEGRHPVVSKLVENFIANDCALNNGSLWLITGPNMAGKSTFLRQQALITILAQIGYFVPAKEAKIGLVDKIFTRIGAADDLAEGQSTFMVEMVETANILNGATEKSLVVLDEIGRGTATYDGLAIAWACVEALLQTNKCRGLFATHYHELTNLEETFSNLSNHHAAVKEWKGDIIFLHQIVDGAAPGSYGIHVAELAGMPEAAINRAKGILQGLEQSSHGEKPAKIQDLPLFTAPATTPAPQSKPSAVEGRLKTLNVDDLTPREAHQLIYQLKELMSESS